MHEADAGFRVSYGYALFVSNATMDSFASSSYLQTSLFNHRLLVLSITCCAVAGSLLYVVASSRPTQQSRPLHRRNAVLRRLQPSASRLPNSEASALVNSGIDLTGNRDATENEDGQEGSVQTDVAIPQLAEASNRSNLQELIYYIAEDSSLLRTYVHRSISCNECNATPIRGIRWRCCSCPSFNLCSSCEATTTHSPTHVFQKIKIPIQSAMWIRPVEPFYSGIVSGLGSHQLDPAIRKILLDATAFEMDEIQVFYNQFRCYANIEWAEDPSRIFLAMDSDGFERAWRPTLSGKERLANILCSRIFQFYDSDGNGLIDFLEFVRGLATLKRKNRQPEDRIRILFDAFDVDRDGYISRLDILKIFDGYYQLQKIITQKEIELLLTPIHPVETGQTINSTRPLNSQLNSHFPGPNPLTTHRKDQIWVDNGPAAVTVTSENCNDHIPISEVVLDVHAAVRGLNNQPSKSKNFLGMTTAYIDQILQDRDARRDFYPYEEEALLLETRSEADTETKYGGGSNGGPANVINATETPWKEQTNQTALQDGLSRTVEDPTNLTPDPGSLNQLLRSDMLEPLPDDDDFSLADLGTPKPNRCHDMRHRKHIARETTYQLMQEAINLFLDPLFQDREVRDLKAQSLRTCRDKLFHASQQQDFDFEAWQNEAMLDMLPIKMQIAHLTVDKLLDYLDHDPKLNDVKMSIEQAGGSGKLGYEDFETLIIRNEEKHLHFLASWLDLGMF